MDWPVVIMRNRDTLKGVVAELVAMTRGQFSVLWQKPRPVLGAPPPEPELAAALPRRLRNAVLRLLRPAESAMRRLIIFAADGLVAKPSPPRKLKPKVRSIYIRDGKGTGIIVPRGMLAPGSRPQPPEAIRFCLADPPRRSFRIRRPPRRSFPRVYSLDGPRAPIVMRQPPKPDDPLDASRLMLRIAALDAALDDLPGQAQRFARWHANRKAALAREKAEDEAERARNKGAAQPIRTRRRHLRLGPLRSGRPPGALQRPRHDVHYLLTDLNAEAHAVLNAWPDTS